MKKQVNFQKFIPVSADKSINFKNIELPVLAEEPD